MENPSEIYRTSYRNKETVKLCILLVLRCECVGLFMQKYLSHFLILNKVGIGPNILLSIANMNFKENPSDGSHPDIHTGADRQFW